MGKQGMAQVVRFGAVTVHLGAKSGKYPEGNQVLVTGADTRVAFDTPLVANRIGADFDDVDLVILGHVHEDHMAGLQRVPRAAVQVHEADLEAARSWDGLGRHYGYPAAVLDEMLPWIRAEFHYAPRADATAYRDGATWDLGGGTRVRAHHLPGHTAGHNVLVVESEGLAFLGDIDLTGFGPYYGDATSSLADFRVSLERVKDLDVSIWVTSHHRGVVTSRGDFLTHLARFAARIDERSERLLAHLANGPLTLDQLAARRIIYPLEFAAAYVASVERRSIGMHLAELAAAGVVRWTADGAWELA